MRIAIDGRLWSQGGVGRYIRNLVWNIGELDKKNEYTLFVPDSHKFQIPKSKFQTNFKVQKTKAGWHNLEEQTGFRHELDKGRFDLVHFPYFSHPVLYNRPFVITIHDLTILKYATGKATTRHYLVYLFKRLGYRAVLRHGISRSRRIIVPTRAVKEDILAEFDLSEDKISVTYEGIGREFGGSHPGPKERLILYVGNFYPHKNVEFLLRAFGSLSRQDYRLVLCGPEDYFTGRIKAHINGLKLDDRVKLVLRPKDNELNNYYRRAKVLVLPSLFEGFGLPVVEGAHFGCLLVLSDIPVFREIAPPGALFFDPQTEADLGEKLVQAMETDRALKADREYFGRFSFRKMAEETIKIYREAAL